MSGEDISEFKDKQILAEYLQMQNVSEDIYFHFIRRGLNLAELSSNQYTKVYVDAFNGMAISLPKKCSEEEAKRIRLEKFYDFALDVEKDKLYYFALVREQRTLIITAPSDNKEQKLFLGYDWSNRKGAEGIIINTPGGKLYNQEDRFARGTLACAVRNSFLGADTILSDVLMNYAHNATLKNLFDWSKSNFDKAIGLITKRVVVLHSYYPIKKISDLILINEKDKNPTESPDKNFIYVDISSVENGTGIVSYDNKLLGKNAPSRARRYALSGSTLVSTVRPNLRAFAYISEEHKEAVYSTGFAILRSKDEKRLLNKLIYIYFMNLEPLMEQIIEKMPKGQYPSINKADIESLQIPVPPIEIQKKIISECEAIDAEYNTSRMAIETYRQKISDIFNKLEVITKDKMGGVKMLKQICYYSNERISMSKMSVADYISTDNLLQNCEGVKPYDGVPNTNSAVKYKKGDILLSNIRPYLKKIWLADKDGGCSPDVLVIRLDSHDCLPEYVYHVMARQQFFDYVMTDVKGMKMPRGNKDNIMRYEIPVIPLAEQQQVINQVKEYKEQINMAHKIITGCPKRKKAVLENYLN